MAKKILLAVLLVIVVVVFVVGAGAAMSWPAGCRALRAVSADGVFGGCRALAAADTALADGRRRVEERQLRPARERFREASAHFPALSDAHLEHGRVAEALGDYDEAIAAYRDAVARSGSRETRLQLASLTARVGDVDGALTLLDGESSWSPGDVWTGVKGGAGTFFTCAARAWPALGEVAVQCAPYAFRGGRAIYRAARDGAAHYAFEILLDAGQRDRALALARQRGWVRADAQYCEDGAWDLGISQQTAAFLAAFLTPERADCLLNVGYQLTNDGLARLGRVALLDRAQHSSDPGVRQRAERFLRLRLPPHDVAKLSEALNITAYRLQSRIQDQAAAIDVYQRAIAADPAFSWPYHNLGRLYHAEKRDEEALTWLRRAMTVNPNHVRALRSLGAAATALERWDEAAGAYQQAIVLDPDDADSYADLGRMFLKMGREADGLRAMQTAVRLDPRRRERSFVDQRLGTGAPAGPSPFGFR